MPKWHFFSSKFFITGAWESGSNLTLHYSHLILYYTHLLFSVSFSYHFSSVRIDKALNPKMLQDTLAHKVVVLLCWLIQK